MTANSLLNVTQKDALKLKPMTMFFKKYVLTRFSKFGKRNVAWYVWKKNMREIFSNHDKTGHRLFENLCQGRRAIKLNESFI